MANITCRNLDQDFPLPHTHHSVEAVRRHYSATGDTWSCTWVIRDGVTGDGEDYLRDCGGLAWNRPDGGWECEAGHEHTPIEVRYGQGWDYAADAYDAVVLAEAGKNWYPAGPTTFIEDAEIERACREVFGR